MPWVEIIVALISVSGTLGAVLLTFYLKKKNSGTGHVVEERIRRDVVIYQILNDIRRKFNFGRVLVAQFHNGNKYYTGEAIQKASVSFETVAPGVTPLSKTMQDIPIGTMTYSLSKISKKGRFCVDSENPCEDAHYSNLMVAFDEITHYAFKIEDDTGWVGVLIADHCTTQTDINQANAIALTESCKEYMKMQASRLSTLLSLSNKRYNVE